MVDFIKTFNEDMEIYKKNEIKFYNDFINDNIDKENFFIILKYIKGKNPENYALLRRSLDNYNFQKYFNILSEYILVYLMTIENNIFLLEKLKIDLQNNLEMIDNITGPENVKIHPKNTLIYDYIGEYLTLNKIKVNENDTAGIIKVFNDFKVFASNQLYNEIADVNSALLKQENQNKLKNQYENLNYMEFRNFVENKSK